MTSMDVVYTSTRLYTCNSHVNVSDCLFLCLLPVVAQVDFLRFRMMPSTLDGFRSKVFQMRGVLSEIAGGLGRSDESVPPQVSQAVATSPARSLTMLQAADSISQSLSLIHQALTVCRTRLVKENKRLDFYSQSEKLLNKKLTEHDDEVRLAEGKRRAVELMESKALTELEVKERSLAAQLKALQHQIDEKRAKLTEQKDRFKRLRLSEKLRRNYLGKEIEACKDMVEKVQANRRALDCFHDFVIGLEQRMCKSVELG